MTAPLRARGRRGDTRSYSDAELALFAAYREHRADLRPAGCKTGADCWVEIGPPGICKNGHCRECGGVAGARPVGRPASRQGAKLR